MIIMKMMTVGYDAGVYKVKFINPSILLAFKFKENDNKSNDKLGWTGKYLGVPFTPIGPRNSLRNFL